MMDHREEYVICAANWYKDLKLKRPDVLKLRGFAPYNVDRGIVFSGWRHANCMYQMVAITGLRQCEAGEEVQGFLTSKNRFVTRQEAAEIAIAQDQFSSDEERDRIISSKYLFSESIY